MKGSISLSKMLFNGYIASLLGCLNDPIKSLIVYVSDNTWLLTLRSHRHLHLHPHHPGYDPPRGMDPAGLGSNVRKSQGVDHHSKLKHHILSTTSFKRD